MRFTSLFLAVLVAMLLSLAPASQQPARATVLFAGGEDVDFTFVGTVGTITSPSTFRTGYARLSLGPNGSGSPPINRITTPTWANTTVFWTSVQAWQTNNATISNSEGVAFADSGGVSRLYLRGTGTAQQIKVSKKNAAGTFTDLVTCSASFPVGAVSKLDIFVNYAVVGEVTLYVNGTQFCDYVGDVTTDGQTTLAQMVLGGFHSINTTDFSEVIVATTDTRSLNLVTCAPQANGTNMTWTGSFANVNGTTAVDATPLTTASNNQTAEFTCPSLPAGSFSVTAVQQAGRLLKGASGPANFRFIARPSSGSTDFDSGTDIGLTFNFTNYRFLWSQNPACSCAWNTGDLGTGVNFGVLSKP